MITLTKIPQLANPGGSSAARVNAVRATGSPSYGNKKKPHFATIGKVRINAVKAGV